jgi:hypothetical protein
VLPMTASREATPLLGPGLGTDRFGIDVVVLFELSAENDWKGCRRGVP